jgi:hypothetical protein
MERGIVEHISVETIRQIIQTKEVRREHLLVR